MLFWFAPVLFANNIREGPAAPGERYIKSIKNILDQLSSAFFIGTRQMAARTTPRGWSCLRSEGILVIIKIVIILVNKNDIITTFWRWLCVDQSGPTCRLFRSSRLQRSGCRRVSFQSRRHQVSYVTLCRAACFSCPEIKYNKNNPIECNKRLHGNTRHIEKQPHSRHFLNISFDVNRTTPPRYLCCIWGVTSRRRKGQWWHDRPWRYVTWLPLRAQLLSFTAYFKAALHAPTRRPVRSARRARQVGLSAIAVNGHSSLTSPASWLSTDG